MKSVLTVGDGIAAWCLNFYLAEKYHVTQIVGPYPSCSLNSTAINCQRGTQKGLSFLGDLMVDSYDEFVSFYQKNQPAGISEGHEIHLFNPSQKWEKRFPMAAEASEYPVKKMSQAFKEKAYFISPERLKQWFLVQTEVQRIDGLVSQIKSDGRAIINGESRTFDHIFICTNYLASTLARGFDQKFDTYLDYCKPVSGTYLELRNASDFFDMKQSLNYSFEGKHLILRPEQNVALLGSTSDQDVVINQSERGIKEIYNFIAHHFDGDLPAFDRWQQITGVRHKGRKRTPYWGQITPQVSVICGLYKNGYSFAFKAARDLVISQHTPF